MVGGSPRILIIRLSAIGDVVRVLPALQILRDALPDAHIDWVVEKKSADVCRDHPSLDGIIVFDRPEGAWNAAKSFLALCNAIRNRRYDIVIDFHGILKSGLLAWASRAPKRYGFARPRSQEGNFLFTNRRSGLPSHTLNRVEENMILCEAVVPARAGCPSATIEVPPEVQEVVDDYVDRTFEAGKRLVAVHAPIDRREKRWPLDYFAEVCDLLIADGRFEVMLTWGPGQQHIAQTVFARCRRGPVIAPETPDLKHYAGLVGRANLYVGGDTGPMHIAAAMGTPVVAIFTGTNAVQHAPYQSPCEVLTPERAHELLPQGETAEEALSPITPPMVYDACVRLLSPKKTAG
ncbi:MAG TPA: glycosyltransferase family 9 protein [Candidatus Hydrogenedentes bacterium]|nr:glycosyltransferase family 9 protein [Candidatus Hydrogenedentota bacterium]